MQTTATNTRETLPTTRNSCFRVIPQLGGLEWLHARFTDARYARHSHPTYVIGVVVGGVEGFRYRGTRYTATAGHILALNPQEPHDGYAVEAYFRYRMIYPSVELMQAITGDHQGTPYLRGPVIHDPELAARLAAAHAAVDDSRLDGDVRLHQALHVLAQRHGNARPLPTGDAGDNHPAIALARDRLASHPGDAVSLAELATLTGLPEHRLIRTFTRCYGLPPHAWQLNHRIQTARSRLAAQEPIADLALDLGFTDQAHFHRRFRERVGVTPGVYQQACVATHNAMGNR